MRVNSFKKNFQAAIALAALLLVGAGASQAQVNLTAQPATALLPDGQSVPMWGYTCQSSPQCAALNPNVKPGGWSPIVITIPPGDLTINLTNALPKPIPTSLTIVGVLGGGLGTTATTAPSPSHAIQGPTWPIAGNASGAALRPPLQSPRVQSFATEVGNGSTTSLTWVGLKPGTYLIESGTHPSIQGPMGLYGVLVVTTVPVTTTDTTTNITTSTPGTAYTGVSYNAEVVSLLSEIDAAQNQAVAAAVATAGFSETSVRVLRDSVSSVTLAVDASGNVINAGTGYQQGDTFSITGGGGAGAVASVQSLGAGGTITGLAIDNPGSGYSSVPTNITPLAVHGSGAQLSASLSLAGTICSDGAAACYPPAVNYDPRYYLVNGVSFDTNHPEISTFAVNPSNVTGNLLVRFVNAGLRMHVPSIVGAQTSAAAGVVPGFSLIAEDANVLPEVTLAVKKGNALGARVQNEVFLAAGKVYDVLLSASAATTLPMFDRQLSLSTNNQRNGGMQAYFAINGGATSGSFSGATTAKANDDSYFLIKGKPIVISDASKGVIANDVAVYGVALLTPPSSGTVVLNQDGTFTYTPNATATSDSFTYSANGNPALVATVNLNECAAGTCLGAGPALQDDSYTSLIASRFQVGTPGVLANDTDPQGHPLTASAAQNVQGGTVTLNPDGSFTAIPAASPVSPAPDTQVTFEYTATNSQNTPNVGGPAKVTVTFKAGSNLQVKVVDGPSAQSGAPVAITDYRWIIEEDRTFLIDPNKVNNGASTVPSLGTNFHTSYMPVVAAGCVGTVACEAGQTVLDPQSTSHFPAVCDIGNGACRIPANPGDAQQAPVDPKYVALDPSKRYYISILPGDAGNPFAAGAGAPVAVNPSDPNSATRQFSIAQDCPSGPGGADFAPGSGTCGHGMGGAPIAAGASSVTVLLQETPYPTAKIAVFVFEDDFPLNGEADTGGGVDTVANHESGLGGFEITLFDDAGGTGDATGQMTYDMFNMPLSNSLAGTIDQRTGFDACPISASTSDGLVGRIITCPHLESDGKTQSPLEGQVVIANMMPGRYGVVAHPSADRISRGEEWLQTNTLDGQKAHDSFMKVGGPAYFQEFGPAGYHVAVGFANPKIINGRLADVCKNVTCTSEVKGLITKAHISRTPDERIYSTGTNDALNFTQCYISLGDADGMDFAFTKCNPDGSFDIQGLPAEDVRLTIFDQWNDQIVDGLAVPARLNGGLTDLGEIPVQQWHTNIYTQTYFDQNGNGIRDNNEPGLTLLPTNIRFRDGSYSNFNNTDLNGNAGFNEIFPLFNWYLVEADTTRYKQTGVHVIYDAGGAVATTGAAAHLAATTEAIPVPLNLRVPGAVYCSDPDCASGEDRTALPNGGGAGGSTGRIDPPWVTTEGWQGFIGSSEFVEFGKAPFLPGETGGIHGEVIYASTRPFDDPALLIHTSWTPDVPGVTINLYQETTAADGTQTLKLVDTTKTTSWDDWAQGFRSDGVPNMNCPGQGDGTQDLFFYTLQNTTQWLNQAIPLPNKSQFKCYDGLHSFNQVQPAPYDGMYNFPSVTSSDLATGKPSTTNCSICTQKDTNGMFMLPAGKYVVEMIVPQGYELVKEEDKNILIGDNYIAPVTQQFGGLGSIFILPDQAEVAGQVNPNNPQNPTNNLGSVTMPRHEGDTGSVETFWPCVGQLRIVPDYISLFPQSAEVAPFAGASRHLCDRKEVTLEDQSAVLAKFWVFSSTHVAAHFTGFILDDFSSEFDPFAPQFGEKFAVPNLPVSIKDFSGAEVSRLYSDQWGQYNGLNYSTWEVNPPNPTGYAPTMMVACMNDPGPIPGPNGTMITDPLYNPSYSQFCYEIPYMPGQTQYMDTPVVPTAAFAEGYNPVDCAYPDATPAVAEVDGDGIGPWVSQTGKTITITALGDKLVPNNAYSGPSATTAPFNQKFITRHYGFGGLPTACPTPGVGVACPNVTVGGVPLTNVSWSDTKITGTVQSIPALQSTCPIQQQGAPAATCGELVITAANGKKSIDTVTVTIGGKAPTYVGPENAQNNAIQAALDSATPGDLLILKPGVYNEMLVMWKPVRLQGVGAASVNVNANTHPSGKIDPWRRQVACLFGLALDGGFVNSQHGFDPSGTYTCDTKMLRQVDAIPLEPIVGWDPTLNGNIAELLQEPTLMGAYEGAGITVLAKGVQDVNGQADQNCVANGVCTPLTNSVADCAAYPSNFKCNPSRIDGITFSNSSQGGGGIFLHGWNHSMEVANNRVFANAGTLSGGITVGQPETTDGTIVGTQEAAFLYNANVHVHNNSVTQNASYGDELNSTTPEAAGGVTFCTGSDYYRFDYNWVCGNLSAGDGGGFAHFGFSYNGTIANNSFLFNQSFNPTIPTHGGGIAILGAPPDGTNCENNQVVDQDCAPQLSDGVGPGLVIDSNLILGNSAESGSGGGLRLQSINGTDVQRNPGNSGNWYGVSVINNIIANNVAGWDGGGVALQDALLVNFINNTVVSNDTTASAGVLFNTGGAASANVPPPGCAPNPDPNQPQSPTCQYALVPTNPQPAGFSSTSHTSNMDTVIAATPLTCPIDHPNCMKISDAFLANNLFWQNRAFHIKIGGLAAAPKNQQNLVTLIPQLNQPSAEAVLNGVITGGAGACTTSGIDGSSVVYWDLGVQGDAGAGKANSPIPLNPRFSVLDDQGYDATNYLATSAGVVSQYCNGSRVPPENGGLGYDVPPGIADATLPNPVFGMATGATVDEGNNWVNTSYGPLSLVHPVTQALLGNYALAPTSPAIDKIKSTDATFSLAPSHDFFGNPRPDPGNPYAIDIGAHEHQAAVPVIVVSSTALNFGTQNVGTTSAAQTFTITNSGPTGSTLFIGSIALGGSNPADFISSNNCPNPSTGGLIANAVCTVTVSFKPTAANARTATISITSNAGAIPQVVTLSGTGIVPPQISVSPTSLIFGIQSNNTTSAAKVVTVTNTGGSALIISSIPKSGTNAAEFTATNNCPIGGAGLAPNGQCTISVTFRPTTQGNRVATITINSNASNAPALAIQLTGGVRAFVSPTSLAFGNVVAGTTSVAQALTLTNTGGAFNVTALTFSSARYSRPAGAAARGTCPAFPGTMPANTFCTINVVFQPNSLAAVNATLTITATGVTVVGSPVTLTGTGILGLNPTSRDFGNVRVNATAAQVFTLTNFGATPITGIQQAVITGVPDFSIIRFFSTCGPAGNGQLAGTTTINQNQSCFVTVQFRPGTVGVKNATISVTDSAGVQSAPLTGTGN